MFIIARILDFLDLPKAATNISRRSIIAALMIFAVIMSSSMASAHAPGFATALTDAQVLELPQFGLSPIATVPAGETVVLTGDVAPGFVYVTFDGGSGWVNADLLSVSGRPGIDTSVVTSRTLILDAPFPDGAELATLDPGDAIILTGAIVGDYAAATKDGVGGWVNRADIGPTPLE